MRPITAWTFCILGLSGFCGCQQEVSVPETTEVESLRLSPHLAIIERPLHEPLTDDEVSCFIELVRSFPGGKLPELSQVPSGSSGDSQSPEELAQAARQSIRDSLSVDTLIQGWSPTTSVRRTIQVEQVEPRAMVSLMLRLSCAVAADAIGSPRDVRAQRVIADEKVDSLIRRIYALQQAGRSVSEPLLDSLHENAALAEYLTILSEIPDESQQLVADHREALAVILPTNSPGAIPLEDRAESQITPVSLESIDTASKSPHPRR